MITNGFQPCCILDSHLSNKKISILRTAEPASECIKKLAKTCVDWMWRGSSRTPAEPRHVTITFRLDSPPLLHCWCEFRRPVETVWVLPDNRKGSHHEKWRNPLTNWGLGTSFTVFLSSLEVSEFRLSHCFTLQPLRLALGMTALSRQSLQFHTQELAILVSRDQNKTKNTT